MPETTYNDDSIKALKGADRVRKRPSVMLGSDDLKGAFHAFKEILGNSLDETRAGYGKVIRVVLYADGSLSIQDEGRGVPMDWNAKEERYNWQLVFDELYAGGKYDDSEYKFSVGLNGVGATATQYTSEYMDVVSCYGGKRYTMHFKRGIADGDLQTEEYTGATGTFIKWKPDNLVFTDTKITFRMLKDYCTGQAHINCVTLELIDEAKPSNNVTIEGKGIKYRLCEVLGDNVITCFDNADAPEESKTIAGQNLMGKDYNGKVDFVIAITEECTARQLYYHNTAEVHNGQHDLAFRDVLNEFFKDASRENGVTIQPYDYNDYVSVIISTYSNITSFANQTKDSVNSGFIYDLIHKSLSAKFKELKEKNNPVIKDMINKAVNRALARKAAKEAEMLARKAKKATTNKRSDPIKFKACREKDPKKRELYIVEGDSALGSCKDARNADFQALIPVMGKTLNCLKAPMDAILNNAVVQDIIQVLGCGIDVGGETGVDLFNIDNLKYDKIIIATDGDVDGFQIRVLVFSMLYRLTPKLIEEGKVYIVESPLFELETSQGSKFAYTVAEKDKMMSDLRKQGIRINRINRSKGLGENTPEMLSVTTMSPETRKLTQLKFSTSDALVMDIVNMLFGADPHNLRKDFIADMLGQLASESIETTLAIEEQDKQEEVSEQIIAPAYSE